MIVYHGSTEIIKNPDVSHSKKYLDFGKGFYITTFEKVSGFWPGILYYNFRKSGKEMGSPKGHETGKECNS